MLILFQELNANIQNYDSGIVGNAPLAKKIRGCKFADLIKEMEDKEHSVPSNGSGEPHCFSWHL